MSTNSQLYKIRFTCNTILLSYHVIVKSGKFGKSEVYLKKNPNQEAVISFQLVESKTKVVKKEIHSSPFLLKEKIFLLKDENITM